MWPEKGWSLGSLRAFPQDMMVYIGNIRIYLVDSSSMVCWRLAARFDICFESEVQERLPSMAARARAAEGKAGRFGFEPQHI